MSHLPELHESSFVGVPKIETSFVVKLEISDYFWLLPVKLLINYFQ